MILSFAPAQKPGLVKAAGLLFVLALCGCAGSRPAPQNALMSMRLAMHHHVEGEWVKSNAGIEAALRILQGTPKFQLGRGTAALFTSDKLARYKGSDYELAALHSLGMINYMMLGQKGEALVEARRSDDLFKALEADGHELVQDPLARYLAAKLYESEGLHDDAYIDLLNARRGFEILGRITGVPEPGFLGGDLYRLALRSRGREEAGRWLKSYPRAAPKAPGLGEVWLLAWHGRLRPLQAEFLGTAQALRTPPGSPRRAQVDGREQALELVYDFSALAAQAQDQELGGDILKGLLRLGLRVPVLLGMALFGGGAADGEFLSKDPGVGLRRWENLPAHLLACRLELPPGRHRIRVVGEGTQDHELSVLVRQDKIALVRLVLESQGRDALSPSVRP